MQSRYRLTNTDASPSSDGVYRKFRGPGRETRIIKACEAVLSMVREFRWPLPVASQLFDRMMYHISCTVFNEFMSNPQVCVVTYGFQTKLVLSAIEAWLFACDSGEYYEALHTCGYV